MTPRELAVDSDEHGKLPPALDRYDVCDLVGASSTMTRGSCSSARRAERVRLNVLASAICSGVRDSLRMSVADQSHSMKKVRREYWQLSRRTNTVDACSMRPSA